MQKALSGKLFSASDLVNFSACSHLTHLDLLNLETPLPKAADSEEMVLIQGKGFEHEGRYLERLQAQYGEVIDLKTDGTDAQAFANTRIVSVAPSRDCLRQIKSKMGIVRHFYGAVSLPSLRRTCRRAVCPGSCLLTTLSGRQELMTNGLGLGRK